MHAIILFAAAAVPETIVVTASREPLAEREVAVSTTTLGEEELEALGLPLAADTLRLVPGVSVSVSGPRGTLTQLRVRGAEANHSLLFVDGIRFNDPAAGNEARFELLATDLLSRIQVVRGPQSALWGSEALGGVIAVETPDPFGGTRAAALVEYGSMGSKRVSAQGTVSSGGLGLSASAGSIESEGIDSFGAGGERDGFENRSASLRAVFRPRGGGELGAAAYLIEGRSEYDGFDPATFRRADTLDETSNRMAALRGWGSAEWRDWSLSIEGSLLDSANRNRLGAAPLNSTFGSRVTVGGQLSRTLGGHRFTAAAEQQGEEFRARDQVFFGGTDQDRGRSLTALVGEWHAAWSDAIITDVAVRHDSFSAFVDATTVRAALLVRPVEALALHASFGEGIAQPTFYDLFGFFPGSFVGNPSLRPERSRGWEAGVRWSGGAASVAAAIFDQRLRDEIVDVFDPATFLASTRNAEGKSRRRGLEISGEYRLSPAFGLSANYTFLDADERQSPDATAIREVRRPRHSVNIIASGEAGRLGWGASLSYVGARRDTDFDLFPAAPVTLGDYLLASARLGFRLTDAVEAYARVENALGADYQDVVGYDTPGRSIYAGLRFRLDR